MADSFTPTLNLTKPEINQSINTWGNKLNGDMDLIDQFATETETKLEDHEERIDTLEVFRVPVGGIIMWSGTLNTIPAGWALCNGANGTPNLQERFVLGAHPARLPGDAGGAFSQFVGTSAAGVHAHSGATAAHAITEGQMPFHAHGVFDPGHAHPMFDQSGIAGPNGAGNRFVNVTVGNDIGPKGTDVAGTGISIAGAGGNQGHAHGIVADGNHAHTVTVPTVPPYYALAFIMKLPPT